MIATVATPMARSAFVCGWMMLVGITGALAQDPARNCQAPKDVTRLDHALLQTARRLEALQPVKIVAIGSSSTAGAGASSSAASYPSRLEAELRLRFPGRKIEVINQGVNGETATDMVARFERDVIAERPSLVLWQVGSNTVLRDEPHKPAGGLIREGVRRIKQAGADVVLINPQFAPKILTKHDYEGMLDVIEAAAKESHVGVFRRFGVMRHWRETQRIPYHAFLSADELHMNDWSYGCLAKLLSGAIAEAATRSTLTARALTRE